MRLLLLSCFFIITVSSYKFLAYSPQFGTSHMHFITKLADALVDAGHEVVMLIPVMDPSMKISSPTKARVIKLPQAEKGDIYQLRINQILVEKMWQINDATDVSGDWYEVMESWQYRCNATARYPGLMEQLRAEKFDVAFGESLDYCMPGLFRLMGIEKWAVTDILAMNDGHFYYTHTPTNPAYVPCLLTAGGGEAMTFSQRSKNVVMLILAYIGRHTFVPLFDKVFHEIDPTMPGFEDLAATNSLVFINSEPLVDFPRPTSARMIDIGGITVSNAASPLNKTWSDMLDLRPKTVIISFGSFAKAHLMPTPFKNTIRETVKKFTEVTFIWKYEKPEHKISEGIENLIETTWMPQNDILHDPRLSAFITHCGQGSTTEANYAGVPLVVIPVAFDQLRNAEQMDRIGVGIVMDRKELTYEGPLEVAIRNILENKSYKEEAVKLKQTLLDRPFPMKEIFLRNMEFLAKHGPLRQLDHYGRKLSFIQYYLLDVIGLALFIIVAFLIVILFTIRFMFKFSIRKLQGSKTKTE